MKRNHQIKPAPRQPHCGDGQPADLAQRQGHERIFERATSARRKWPSQMARDIAAALTAAGIAHERQVRLGDSLYAADFVLPAYGVAILLGGPVNGYRRGDAMLRRAALCRTRGLDPIAPDSLAALDAALAARTSSTPAALAA